MLIDCFVTTKLTIPCIMALIPTRANFWPRKQPEANASQQAINAQPQPWATPTRW